jgi:hypothetical protein
MTFEEAAVLLLRCHRAKTGEQEVLNGLQDASKVHRMHGVLLGNDNTERTLGNMDQPELPGLESIV